MLLVIPWGWRLSAAYGLMGTGPSAFLGSHGEWQPSASGGEVVGLGMPTCDLYALGLCHSL